jgi:hypothetical protein
MRIRLGIYENLMGISWGYNDETFLVVRACGESSPTSFARILWEYYRGYKSEDMSGDKKNIHQEWMFMGIKMNISGIGYEF